MLRFRLCSLIFAGVLVSVGCAEGDTLTGGGTGDGAGSQGGETGNGSSTSTGTSSSSSSSTSSSSSSSASSSSSSSTGGGGGGGDPCGDGVIDAGEDCDGAALGGATCVSIGQGFTSGELGCAPDCTFDVSACITPPTCGNGTLDVGETCDGMNLAGQTCQSQGFTGGTLACNAGCTGFNTAGCTTMCTPVNLLTNGGFDNGPFGGGWTESSLNFGSPVCDVATCGMGGGTGPQQGIYWVWFGGTNLAFESASVSRSVVIPPGMATLRFWLDMPVCEDPLWALDQLTVTIDGNVLYQTTNLDPGCGAVGYQQLSFDLSAYANGQSHSISFSATTDDFIDVTNFMIDTVELMGCP